MMSFNLYIYISIIVLSIMSGSVLSKIVFKKYVFKLTEFKFNKNYFKALFFLCIIPLSTCIIMIFSFILIEKYNNDQSQKIESIMEELKEKEKQNKLFKEYQHKLEIISILQDYYQAYYERDIKRVDTFYVFPLEKFFTLKNVPEAKVNERIKFYWNHHKDSLFHINLDQTDIIFKDKDTIQVSIKMSESENQTIFTKIKMNRNKKIFYIGNTIMTNYYDEKSYDSIPTKKKRLK